MNALILFGVIVAAEVVADRAITYLDDRRKAKDDAPKTWAGESVFTHQSVLDKIIGNLSPEQKRWYGAIREKLRQTSDATKPRVDIPSTLRPESGGEGAVVGRGWKPPITQEFGKPPFGWQPPYGHAPFGPPYREPGLAPDYKTYPEKDA